MRIRGNINISPDFFIGNRMNDVKKRYGFYPQDKWNCNMKLKQYFEEKLNKDIYLVCEKDTFVPGDL